MRALPLGFVLLCVVGCGSAGAPAGAGPAPAPDAPSTPPAAPPPKPPAVDTAPAAPAIPPDAAPARDAAAPMADAQPAEPRDAAVPTDAKPMRPLAAPTGPLCFGADCDGKNPFPGQLDRIRLYDRALSAEAIAAHASRRYDPCASESGCVGEWTFDEPAVDGAFASTGPSPLPAVIVGDVALEEGPDGKALKLAGAGRLQLGKTAALAFRTTFTFEAWVRRSSCPAGFPGPVPCRFMRLVDSTGSFKVEHHAGGQTTRMPAGGYIGDPWSPTDKWTHVAFVFDTARTFFMFYVGGKPATKLQRW